MQAAGNAANVANYPARRPPEQGMSGRNPFPAFAAQRPPISGPMIAPPPIAATPSSSFASLPPMFILALLLALIGIPIFLVAQGVLKASTESLESHIRGTDTSGYGADEDAGEDEGREKRKDKGDIGNGALDVSDLKGLGGLVGVAALIVICFSVFPDEIEGVWSGIVGGGVAIPLVGTVGGSTSKPPFAGQAQPLPGGTPDTEGRDVYTDPGTGQRYPLPAADPYQDRRRYPPNVPPYDPYTAHPPPEYASDYDYEDPYGHGAPPLGGGMFAGKSVMEILMLCKIAPQMCEGLDLAGLSGSDRTRITIGGDDQDVDVTVERGSGVTEGLFVVPTSSVERHMAMLRTQPILLIGYDPDIIPEDMLIYIAFGLLIPILYAFGELLSNAYEHDDELLIEDKVADVKQQQLKQQRDAEGEKQVTEAELGYYKKLYDERKREVNTLAERPWWAGSSWKPPWTEEDLEIEMEKDPDAIEMFRGASDWGMKRKKGYEGKFIPVKMGSRFAEMNLKMKKLAANKEIQGGKVEAIKKRWGDDKKNFYPGMDPIEGITWRSTSRGTLSKEARVDKEAADAKQKLQEASVELQEARALLKAKKEPPKQGRGKEGQPVQPTFDQKKKYGFHLKLWDEREKDDARARDEALTPKALWLKKEGKSVGDMSLTAEQREMKELDEQIEANKKLREDKWQETAKAKIAARPGATAQDRLFSVWQQSKPGEAEAYLKAKGKK